MKRIAIVGIACCLLAASITSAEENPLSLKVKGLYIGMNITNSHYVRARRAWQRTRKYRRVFCAVKWSMAYN